MNNVNKTLYIPLYGKAYVSKKGCILHDPTAEVIWNAEGFPLKGKAKSKWLAYYMGMRSAVFDKWLHAMMQDDNSAVVLHLGCGMDSRIHRVGTNGHFWYDVDFPEVITERKRYFTESDSYHMVGADVRCKEWLSAIPVRNSAIVVMEGISMYLSPEELHGLFRDLQEYFDHVTVLMDSYTVFAAKASKYKNPINEVGVTLVYGTDDPHVLDDTGIRFAEELEITPAALVDELKGMEKKIFQKVFAGSFSKKMYRLYEYRKV